MGLEGAHDIKLKFDESVTNQVSMVHEDKMFDEWRSLIHCGSG